MFNLLPQSESLDESQTQVKFTNPSNLVFERKFDTAMRESHVTRFLKRINNESLNREDKVIFDNKKFNQDEIQIDESLYAKILYNVLSTSQTSRTEVNQAQIKTITRIIRHNLTLQTDFQIDTIKIPLWKVTRQRKFQTYLNNIIISPQLTKLITLVDKINGIVDKLNDAYYHRIHNMEDDEYISYCIRKNRLIVDDDLELYWNKEYLFCIYQNQSYLLPRVYILMIHNKLCDLISVLVLSMYSNQSVFPYDSTERIINFVTELCHLHMKYKRRFFSISKVIEALCYAETLLEVEEWKNIEFLTEICSGLDEIDFDYMSSDLRIYITSTSAEFRHELCCLSKIVGHPLVDMEAGAKAIHKKVTEQYELTVEQLIRCECYIKQNYIRNHILTGRGWPPVSIDPGAPETLRLAWVRNLDPDADALKKKYKPIDIMDYMFVEILPNLTFNKLENIIPHLKDKTVSLCRRKIISQLINCQMEPEKPRWEETRLLLVYLMNPSYVTDHVSYLDDINRGVPIEEFHNYLICRIVPKEKEHKVEFRGFGCKTPQDRARSLAQEINSKHYLDLFSDEQAMTLSELDLTKVLHSFRHLEEAYKGYRVLYITLDASSWNNHFRKETVDDLMVNTLSKIYNHQVFSNTHKFYKNCLHYVPDGDVTYYWEGQDGGIEGLNQDTWVITYIAQIKTTLHDKNLRYHIMCKGDDFRLAVLIPKANLEDKSLKEYKDDIVKTISLRAKDLGHKIKVEESFGSAKYFMFSKHASIEKVEMPETIRKIMKCHGSNNSFINTCDEYIGSTFSNAHSACKASPIAIPQYAVALFWSLFYLTRHPIYKDCLDIEYEALLLVPSMCGGFPIIYLHNMYVRAESDLLSPFLHLINFCSKVKPELAKLLKRFCIVSVDPPKDYIQLYKDPYSLPSPRPKLPSAVLRQAILPSLKKVIKNENVLELLEAQESIAQTMCEKTLNSSNFLVIKLLSRIYSATPSAIIEELTRKFESARSILELLTTARGRRRAMNILRNVIKCEYKLQRWRKNVLTDKSLIPSLNFYQINYSECPGEFCDKVREWAWKKKIIGITMPAIQHLVSYTSISFANTHDIQNHFSYSISDDLKYSSSSKNRCFADGKQKPFLGHVTNSGTVSAQLRFVQKDVILRHVSDLLEIHAWSQLAQATDEEGNIQVSNLHVLIERLLGLYTSEPLDKLILFQTPYKGGGTQQHHTRCKNFRAGIIPNTLVNLYTQITGSTDTHNRLANSHDHFLFNFLHIYCHSVSVIFSELDYSRELTSPLEVWGVTNDCGFCNDPIREDLYPVRINEDFVQSIRFFPLQMTNVGKQMKQVLKLSLEKQQSKKFLDNPEYQTITYSYACQGIIQHLFSITIDQTRSLQARYTSHALNDQARSILSAFVPKLTSKEIGLTEIKKLEINLLADLIVGAVYTSLYDYFNMEMIPDTHLGFLSNYTGSELPWYSLLYQLYRANKLIDVMSKITSMAGNKYLYCQQTPLGCSHAIGQLSVDAITKSDISYPFIVIGTLAPGDVSSSIRRYIIGWTWRHMNKTYILPYQCTHNISLLIRMLIWLSMKPFDLTRYNPLEVSTLEPEMNYTDIVDLDIEGCREMIDSDDLFEAIRYELITIQRLLNIPYSVFDQAVSRFHEFIEDVIEEIGQIKIETRVVSLPSAISIVRSIDISSIDESSSENSGDIVRSITPLKFLTMIKVPRPEIRRIKIVRLEDMKDDPFDKNPIFSPDPIRHIYHEFINRPFGQVTHTYSLMLYILEHFNGAMAARNGSLFWTEIGGGYGNTSTILTLLYPTSQGLYLSKPVQNPKATRPHNAIQLTRTENRSTKIMYEQCASGIWDITSETVCKEIRKLQPINNIIVCNIDKFDTPEEMWDVFVGSFSYFLDTSTADGYFIISLSNDHWKMMMKIISQISLNCEECYLLQPPFVRCFYNIYILAHRKNNVLSIKAESYHSITVQVQEILTSWLPRFTIRSDIVDLQIPKMKVSSFLRERSPVMALSLLSDRFGLDIQQSIITGALSSGVDMWSRIIEVSKEVLKILKLNIQTLLKKISGIELTKNAYTDHDFRATRKMDWEKIFVFEGLKFILISSCKEKKVSIIYHNIKQYFISIINDVMLGEGNGFGPRNKTFLPDSENFYYAKRTIIMVHNQAEKFQFWANFCHGIEIGLSLISYIAQIPTTD